MYLLFKSASQKDLGIIQRIGSWSYFTIGYLPDSHKEIVEYRHLNPRIISEDVAYAYMFIDAYKGDVSVRTETPQNDRLAVLTSEEDLGTKTKYYLTDEDKANATIIIQELMRLMLDEVYDKRMIQLNLGVSSLEYSSWEQQKLEAAADGGPLLQALATARGITEAEMVQKVNDAVTAYNAKVAELLAAKQAVETEIKNCADIADCHRLLHNRFEISMSAAQMADEGITSSATFNL